MYHDYKYDPNVELKFTSLQIALAFILLAD